MTKKTKYITVKLPDSLITMIDILIEERGFTSRTDIIKYLVRKYSEGKKENGNT